MILNIIVCFFDIPALCCQGSTRGFPRWDHGSVRISRDWMKQFRWHSTVTSFQEFPFHLIQELNAFRSLQLTTWMASAASEDLKFGWHQQHPKFFQIKFSSIRASNFFTDFDLTFQQQASTSTSTWLIMDNGVKCIYDHFLFRSADGSADDSHANRCASRTDSTNVKTIPLHVWLSSTQLLSGPAMSRRSKATMMTSQWPSDFCDTMGL